MINVRQLLETCGAIVRERDGDIPVYMHIMNDDGTIDVSDNCQSLFVNESGILFLTNYPFTDPAELEKLNGMVKKENKKMAKETLDETCKDCAYYYGEIDNCMFGEPDIPNDMIQKCKENKND